MKPSSLIPIFVVVAALAIGAFLFKGGPKAPDGTPAITLNDVGPVKVVTTNEKKKFFSDAQVNQTLTGTWKMESVEAKLKSSLEMMAQAEPDADAYWPSSQFASTSALQPKKESGIVCGSPLVVLSWQKYADALKSKGIVKQSPQGALYIDKDKLVNLLRQKVQWKSLGVNRSGPVRLDTTSALRSNSGNIFAGLLYETVASEGGKEVNGVNIKALDATVNFFRNQPSQPGGTEALFENFLNEGTGKPFALVYESQVIQYLIQSNGGGTDTEGMVVLYLAPTVVSNHPLIAVSDKGVRLLTALRSESSRPLLERFGFRVKGRNTAMAPFASRFHLEETITDTSSIPNENVMNTIANRLRQENIN